MIKFNGKYQWDGRKRKNGLHKPITWWPGSCRLTIVDLSAKNPDVHMLKPIIIFAAEAKKGYSAASRYQDLIKNIFREFNLNKDKVLWIKYDIGSCDNMKVAVIAPKIRVGNEMFYSIKWRDLMSNEIDEVSRFFPALTFEGKDYLFSTC